MQEEEFEMRVLTGVLVMVGIVALGFIATRPVTDNNKPVPPTTTNTSSSQSQPTWLGKMITGDVKLDDPRPAWNFQPATQEQRNAVDAGNKKKEAEIARLKETTRKIRMKLISGEMPLTASYPSQPSSVAVFSLGEMKVPLLYSLDCKANQEGGVEVYSSTDGLNWGKPILTKFPANIDCIPHGFGELIGKQPSLFLKLKVTCNPPGATTRHFFTVSNVHFYSRA